MSDLFDTAKTLCNNEVKIELYSNCPYSSPPVLRVTLKIKGEEHGGEESIYKNHVGTIGEVLDSMIEKFMKVIKEKEWGNDQG